MNDDIEKWIITLLKTKKSSTKITQTLKLSYVFERFSEDGHPMDVKIEYIPNNAQILGELEDIGDFILFDKKTWDQLSLETLVKDVILHLQNGGRYRLSGNQFVKL